MADIFKVYGEDGKVEDVLFYPEGSGAAKELEDSGSIYKTNDEDKEIYGLMSEAEATIDIDPFTNTINVDGPEWLTSEIINSDTFKKNYSENKALMSLAASYRQNPSSSFLDSEGKTVTVSDAIQQFADSAQSYASSFADVMSYKSTMLNRFGAEFTDDDVSIANTYYDKSDYNAKGAVFLPKWAMDNYNWGSVESYDEENGTVSAGDFYKEIYKEDFGNDFASKLQEEALSSMEKYMDAKILADATDDGSDEKKTLTEEGRASEIARTIHMFNLVTNNRPEVSAAYNALLFVESAAMNFVKSAGTTLTGIAYLATKPFDMLIDAATPDNEAGELAGGMAKTAYSFISNLGVVGYGSFITGEAMKFVKEGGDFNEFIDGLQKDVLDLFKGGSSAQVMKMRQEMLDYFEGINAKRAMISGAWSAGEFVGDMAYKIAENIFVLNKIGGILGKIGSKVTTIAANGEIVYSTTSGMASFLGKVMSAKQAANLIKGLGFANNVMAQGVLETLLDNTDVVDKALSSGEFTPELMETLGSNIWWNFLGEAGGRASNWFLTRTTPGRIISLTTTKISAAPKYYTNTALAKFFNWVNKGDWDSVVKKVGKEGVEILKDSEAIGKFNAAMYLAKAEAWKTVSSIPVFGKMTEAQKEAIDAAYKIVFADRDMITLAEQIGSVEKTLPQGLEKSAAEAVAEGAEGTEKALAESGDIAAGAEKEISEAEKIGSMKKTFSNRIEENYTYQRKAILQIVNLENQIDANNKGTSLKMTEINNYAGRTFDDYAEQLGIVTKLESQVKGLTQRGSGSFLSKEGAEYLSYHPQAVSYGKKLEAAKAAMAEGDDSVMKTIFGDKRNMKAVEEYYNAVLAKRAALRTRLGGDLADQYDVLAKRLAAYTAKIDDYMMRNGYYSLKQSQDILAWRARGNFGENGEDFFHTARLFNNDMKKSVEEFTNKLMSQPQAFTTKTAAADTQKLKPGNLKDSFLDPNMVAYGKLRAMAGVAQAQEMGRALHAISMPLRAVKGYDMDGKSLYEISSVQKDINSLQSKFEMAFKTGKNSALSKSIRESFEQSGLYGTGLDKLRRSHTSRAEAELGSARTASQSAKKNIDTLLNVDVAGQKDIVSNLSHEELDSIFAASPDMSTVPQFNVKGMKAAEFNEWYQNLPKETQDLIARKLSDQNVNVTNVKKLLNQSPDVERLIKASYLSSDNAKAIRETSEYKNTIAAKAEQRLSNEAKTVLSNERKKYQKLASKIENIQKRLEGAKFDSSSAEGFGDDFVAMVNDTANDIVENVAKVMKTDETFQAVVDRLVKEGGLTESEAEKLVVLANIRKLKGSQLMAPTKANAEGTKVGLSARMAGKYAGKNYNPSDLAQLEKVLGEGVKKHLKAMYDEFQTRFVDAGLDEMLDAKYYWDEVQKAMDDIEAFGVKMGDSGPTFADAAARRRIVQLIDENGDMRFYETDPLYAELTNFKPSYFSESSSRIADAINGVNSLSGEVFRWGTTGVDRGSYISQWFKDPINTAIIGGARPFTNLRLKGIKSKFAAAATDYVPFGEKVFGKYVTEKVSKEVIDTTFAASEAGLRKTMGDEWLKVFKETATDGLSGKAAEKAYKRAVVEYSISDAGYKTLPQLGAKTEAQAYRASDGSRVSASELRAEEYAAKLDEGLSPEQRNAYKQSIGKMRQALDNFFENTSKGQWRESFLRKSVYTTQYRNAIEAGMTAQEAKAWASRYALDATTNFSRSFPAFNKFIKSVPYLSAALNGKASFFRLLSLDPAGVSTRFTYGIVLPYMTLLSESLSDPRNREIYMSLKEYEKRDSMLFIYKGSKIQIPLPEEIAKFLSPFRHAVEEAADANDNSWLDLAASDVLGLFPLDLSGFTNLDANQVLADGENGLWSRIGRGVEKAGSSLMPPLAKSAYMLVSGRDPYTGNEIDTSYTYLDDDGQLQIMDYTQSTIAEKLHEAFPSLSKSAAYKVLQTVLGRSTVSVLDNVADVLTGNMTAEKYANSYVEQLSRSVDGGYDRNPGKEDWKKAIDIAYQKREELINDEGFTKALSALRNPTTSDDKKAGAKATYQQKLDEYYSFLLDMAKNMKESYPEQYTNTRVAQIVSLMTLPTGSTYNETEYSKQLNSDSYYDAKDSAVDTFLRMGFPQDTAGNNVLGSGYYDNNGEYQFKVFTPYEIQSLQNQTFGASDQFQALITSALKAADIDRNTMWEGYYKATDKASRKEYKQDWNMRVVESLSPIFTKYSPEMILNNSGTRDMLDQYIFVDNPYKTKEYLYEIFGAGN